MKTFKIENMKAYLIIVLAILAFSGCSDLEEEPIGLLAPEVFYTTASDVEASLMGAYGRMASESYFGRKLPLTLLLRGDMLDIGDRGTPARRQQVNDFDMDADNGMVTAIWPSSYQVIGACNATIEGAEIVGIDNEKVKSLEAEARFLRAFTYYHLIRLFGDVPYIDAPINDPNALTDILRTPITDIYGSIIIDMAYAKEHLLNDGSNKGRPSSATASAYLASIYLTLEDWQAAYDEAIWVIDNAASYNVSLMDDYQDVFNSPQSNTVPEHLFAIDFLGNTNAGPVNVDWLATTLGPRGFQGLSLDQPSAEGWSVAVPAKIVFDNWDDRDYRHEVSKLDSGVVNGVFESFEAFAPNHGASRPHVKKYFTNCGDSRGNCGISDNNYIAMRYAEVILIAAEALNQLGGAESEILGYLDQLRARARNWNGTIQTFPEDVQPGLGQAALHDVIIDERRLELAFEWKRWYDIKRLEIGDQVFKGANSLEPHENFDAAKDYLLPIPQDERDRNENLTQNFGY